MAIVDTERSVLLQTADYVAGSPDWQGTTVTISSITLYHAPVADAGSDQSAPPGATVTLDGTGTYDLDGDLSTATWSQTAGPTVTLDTTSPFQPTFVAPASSTPYSVTFRIVPRDAAGRTPHSGFTYPAGSDNTVTILIDPALDTEAPVITPPGNISENADAVTNSAVIGFVATVSDNVDTPDRFTPVYTLNGNVITSPYDFPAGIHTVTVTANADSSGNLPTPVDFQVEVVDVTPPTVAIGGMPVTITDTAPFTVTFDFSEDVIGFDVSDIQITGASLSGFMGGGSSFSVSVTPSASGNVALTILDGAATDLVGNPLIGFGAQSAFDSAPRTGELISNSMMRRASNLLANQPDLLPLLLDGKPQGGFDLFATKGQMDFDLSYSDGDAWWFQLRGSRSEIAGAESQYVLGTIGAHMTLSENFLLGAMIEVDDFQDVDGAATVSGTGWLAGPYFVARHPDHPLYFDGRFLMGQSTNQISPFGTYTDEFSTDRVLATLRMTGAVELDPWTLMPFLSLQHTSDAQAAYVDSLGASIPSHRVSLTEMELGLDWSYAIDLDGVNWGFTGGLSGVYADATQSGGAVNTSAAPPEFRTRLDLGLTYARTEKQNLTLDIFVDGLGAEQYSIYGVGVSYRYDF